jgi:transposase
VRTWIQRIGAALSTAGQGHNRTRRAWNANLFFPPKYSHDLNPIEQVFAKPKHMLRKAAAHAAIG